MRKLDDIGLLFHPGVRGLMYLAAFIKAGTLPGVIISQGETTEKRAKDYPPGFWERYAGYFDHTKSLDDYVKEFDIEHIRVPDRDVNSPLLTEAVSKRPEKTFVFSGGGIIGKGLLSIGKKFIHIHPGLLPYYRGSTCFYYSILKEDNWSASAFFMEPELDTGDVLGKRRFEVPEIESAGDWQFYDEIFDPFVRAELLFDIIKGFLDSNEFSAEKQDTSIGEIYFIIHPVLKNLAIKRSIKQKD